MVFEVGGGPGGLSGGDSVSRGGWSVEWGFLRSAGGSGGLSGGDFRFLGVGGVLSGAF